MKLTTFTKKANWVIGNKKMEANKLLPECFNVENYKEISFNAYILKNYSDNIGYQLQGDLTIKNSTRRINLDVDFGGVNKDRWGNKSVTFVINGKIDRVDWGPEWNTTLEAHGIKMNENIWVSCEVQLAKQPQLPYFYSFFYSIYTAHSNYLLKRRGRNEELESYHPLQVGPAPLY